MSDLSQESPFWREWAESRHSVQQMREELERLRAENARLLGDHAAALRLVADVRAAIGDYWKRMQPELIEYCKAMKRDAAAAPELVEALKETRDCVVSCLNVEENASYSRPERAEYYRELLEKVDAALAKAGVK